MSWSIDSLQLSNLSFLFAARSLLCRRRVNLSSERSLETESNGVCDDDDECQDETSWLAEPECDSGEAHAASPVHWIGDDIEWESSDNVVHEDSKVVSQVGSGDSESPHGRKHKDISGEDKSCSEVFHDGQVEKWVLRLIFERVVVKVITNDTKRENGSCEEVAA